MRNDDIHCNILKKNELSFIGDVKNEKKDYKHDWINIFSFIS